MSTAIVVQARMGSSRLPGKVLKDIAGRPMLSYQMERLRRVKRAERIVVATTDQPADDAVERFCQKEKIACVRGSEHDVLARYHLAIERFPADVVVRITADCPLIDPAIVDEAIAAYEPDYVSNMLETTYPYGMAVEVFSAQALREAHREAKDPAEREHVTPFIYRHPERYRLRSLTMAPNLSHHRWTVDTPEDFELVSRLLKTLKPHFTLQDVLAVLDKHPDWCAINAHVEQKAL
ncbi:MAG TPA: glycosyltransferase family protein [Burkholderiales bacterium]|nr:glycosyltransferase family protein [Burkholderiales bacterium]